MEPDMSKKEVAAVQWLDLKTLMRVLATPPDHKAKTKLGASGNRRGRPPQNARPRSATPRRASREMK
jgi:hypothetical protein